MVLPQPPIQMVDISKHPLLSECYELCAAIELLPASRQQTDLTVQASALLQSLANVLAPPFPAPGETKEASSAVSADSLLGAMNLWAREGNPADREVGIELSYREVVMLLRHDLERGQEIARLRADAKPPELSTVAEDASAKRSTGAPDPVYNITVNGRPFVWANHTIDAEELAVLVDYATGGLGPALTATYYWDDPASDVGLSGSLHSGQSVKVRDGMVFNVVFTGRA